MGSLRRAVTQSTCRPSSPLPLWPPPPPPPSTLLPLLSTPLPATLPPTLLSPPPTPTPTPWPTTTPRPPSSRPSPTTAPALFLDLTPSTFRRQDPDRHLQRQRLDWQRC